MTVQLCRSGKYCHGCRGNCLYKCYYITDASRLITVSKVENNELYDSPESYGRGLACLVNDKKDVFNGWNR